MNGNIGYIMSVENWSEDTSLGNAIILNEQDGGMFGTVTDLKRKSGARTMNTSEFN